MSSILDALKKSERQRSLGRDLIFRNAPSTTRPRLTWFAMVVLVALLLLLVAIGILLFNLLQESEITESAVAEVSSAPAVAQDIGASAVSATTPKLVPRVRVEPAQELLDQARPASRPSPAPKPHAASARTDNATLTEAAPWLSSLPEAFRVSLPPLDVNIHVYSPVESQRILYINNRPVQQGERIQAGVMVEEIVQDGVVLRFRGQRFKLPRPS